MKFGEFLSQKNLVPAAAVEEAADTQRYKPKRLGRILRDLGFFEQKDLNQNLTLFLRPPVLPSATEAAEYIAKQSFLSDYLEWAKEHEVIIYDLTPQQVVCISTCFEDEVLESAELKWNKSCKIILTDSDSFTYLKRSIGRNLETHESLIQLITPESEDRRIRAASPYTSLVRDMIVNAKAQGASDIHIQPTREGVEIRFRLNGDLTTWKELACEHRQSFINETKRLTNLSIAVSGRTQDARASFREWQLDLRASLLPSQYGEKIVLRLLDLTRQFDLSKVGFDTTTLNDLRKALRAKNGVIIISGPTGSGKTTTLYTLLCELDRKVKNIITLEDPIEYGIEGLTQVQVGAKLSFSDALRSVLRQDPDVILVGEIRDAETADLCVKAANTGHLVLSTLHANGAAEVVARLLNLGVDRYMLKSSLRFSAAQRLIKKLCPYCSVPVPTALRATLLETLTENKMKLQPGTPLKVRNSDGCENCQKGVIGRIPILEYMRLSDIQGYLTAQEEDPSLIYQTLLKSALAVCEKGEADVGEVLEIA
ncbi:MAG: GspE/PulE family protein [Bacteriovoracia bacterium]